MSVAPPTADINVRTNDNPKVIKNYMANVFDPKANSKKEPLLNSRLPGQMEKSTSEDKYSINDLEEQKTNKNNNAVVSSY